MKRISIFIVPILLTLVLAFTGCDPNKDSSEGPTFVTIGTGGVTGVYYPTGGAISRVVNMKFDQYQIKATVESTGGSVYNINAVLSGDLQFGVAQSDRQYQALHGEKEWKEKGPQKDLRSVFSIHPESITLIAAANSKIKSMKDLKGKRVNLGMDYEIKVLEPINAMKNYYFIRELIAYEWYVGGVNAEIIGP